MTKRDPALAVIRKVRHRISRDFDNDPARLIAYYIEMQRRIEKAKLVRIPEEARDVSDPFHDAAELGR